ncbi:MAG: bifunctional oligoribonuclease/PAP phosphatase NrnA [Candidatus Brocadiales bacterium]|nr:bifunctional oligoribonuclease/PAP phosphatase NrnA [Candidatus Brocadiales bacterium]
MSIDLFNKLKGLIDRCHRPLITSHIRLDGDAVGSELALYHVLKGLGKEPSIVNDSPVPRIYKFLVQDHEIKIWKSTQGGSASGGPEMFAKQIGESASLCGGQETSVESSTVSSDEPLRATSTPAVNVEDLYDLVIVVDTPSVERVGGVSQLITRPHRQVDLPVINIDHHVCNTNFGTVNWVEPRRGSTGEMIYEFLRQANLEITPKVAEALYVAIITDTGRFTHNNTSSESLRAAAHLIDCGVNPTRIGERLYRANTYGQLQLLAMATKTLSFHSNKRIASVWLTRDMLREAHTPSIDTHDFADIPASIEGVVVGILLRELGEPNKVKVSLRSRDGLDVNKLAQRFGGGGHERAAGFELQGSIQEVQERVVEEINKVMDSPKADEKEEKVPA